MEQSFAYSSGYRNSRIVSFVESEIHSRKILVVSKTSCTACTRAKQLFRDLASRTGVNPSVIEIDKYSRERMKGIMKYISAQTGITTVPQIYINGRFVGGNDTVQSLHLQGRLVPLILKPMNASSTSAANVDGFGYTSYTTAPSLRVCAFKMNTQPASTFQTQMPIMATIPNETKSKDFIGSHIRDSSRSRSRSSVASWSPVSSSFSGYQRNNRQRRPTLESTDLEILSKPARELSTSNLSSSISWCGSDSNPSKNTRPYMSDKAAYMSDEEILSKPGFLSNVNQGTRKRSSSCRRPQDFSTIENEWPSNSRRGFPTAYDATPARKSRIEQRPIKRGTSDWIYISSNTI